MGALTNDFERREQIVAEAAAQGADARKAWLELPGLGQRIVLAMQLSFFVLTSFAVIHAQRPPVVPSPSMA